MFLKKQQYNASSMHEIKIPKEAVQVRPIDEDSKRYYDVIMTDMRNKLEAERKKLISAILEFKKSQINDLDPSIQALIEAVENIEDDKLSDDSFVRKFHDATQKIDINKLEQNKNSKA